MSIGPAVLVLAIFVLVPCLGRRIVGIRPLRLALVMGVRVLRRKRSEIDDVLLRVALELAQTATAAEVHLPPLVFSEDLGVDRLISHHRAQRVCALA